MPVHTKRSARAKYRQFWSWSKQSFDRIRISYKNSFLAFEFYGFFPYLQFQFLYHAKQLGCCHQCFQKLFYPRYCCWKESKPKLHFSLVILWSYFAMVAFLASCFFAIHLMKSSRNCLKEWQLWNCQLDLMRKKAAASRASCFDLDLSELRDD